ncbi:MAG: AraC family transcriptional regulator [Pyrinomonadaceae bacterium]
MDRRVQRIIVLMGEAKCREVTLCEMAQAVNLTAPHLCRLFKAEVGLPPLQYLKHLRMREAVGLLESTFLSVKEVMLRVGFRDESHFVRDFKAMFGLTPTQYRADLQNNDGRVSDEIKNR